MHIDGDFGFAQLYEVNTRINKEKIISIFNYYFKRKFLTPLDLIRTVLKYHFLIIIDAKIDIQTY